MTNRSTRPRSAWPAALLKESLSSEVGSYHPVRGESRNYCVDRVNIRQCAAGDFAFSACEIVYIGNIHRDSDSSANQARLGWEFGERDV